jgi:serine/threonine protein kinase
MKVLKKVELVKKKEYDRILAEKNIMSMFNNDFIVKMYYSFQGKEYLYLVMEYLNGGDLFSLLSKYGYLPEDWVRKYSAEILTALEYLHTQKIVHRDLKPDNILIG